MPDSGEPHPRDPASRLREDIEFLAGRMPHRGANTENERVAAEYIADRLGEYAGDTTIDDFYSVNSFYQLVALYCFDFLFVALFAIWSPWAGVGYGAAIFLMYMAEITGYPVMGRLLPQYETQNVVARYLSPQPRWHLVVIAHCDTPKANYLTDPERADRLRLWHLVLVTAMVLVLLSCFAEGMGVFGELGAEGAEWVRWAGSTVLIGAAFVLVMAENNGEYTRGANGNASGVAALIDLARRLRESPLQTADVTLIATGAKEVWLSGIQHHLRTNDFERLRACFLNIDSVGGGRLHYLTGEGMLHVFRCAPQLVEAAKANADRFEAEPLRYRNLPTDALVPLARGYKALGIMGATDDGRPAHWKWLSDVTGEVDYGMVERAADYAEAIVRTLDNKPPV